MTPIVQALYLAARAGRRGHPAGRRAGPRPSGGGGGRRRPDVAGPGLDPSWTSSGLRVAKAMVMGVVAGLRGGRCRPRLLPVVPAGPGRHRRTRYRRRPRRAGFGRGRGGSRRRGIPPRGVDRMVGSGSRSAGVAGPPSQPGAVPPDGGGSIATGGDRARASPCRRVPVARRRRSSPPATTMALGLVTVVAVLVFMASLGHLTETPRLFGWAWDVELGQEFSSRLTRADVAVIRDDPDVVAVAIGAATALDLDGQRVEAFAVDDVLGRIEPSLLAGRRPRGGGRGGGQPRLGDIGTTVPARFGEEETEFAHRRSRGPAAGRCPPDLRDPAGPGPEDGPPDCPGRSAGGGRRRGLRRADPGVAGLHRPGRAAAGAA